MVAQLQRKLEILMHLLLCFCVVCPHASGYVTACILARVACMNALL